MYAKFGIERELDNKLYYKECVNDDGYLHFHSQVELCIVDEGEMEILINEKKQNLKAGEMCISLSYDAHLYIPVNYSYSTVIVIPLYMCTQFVNEIKDKKVINPFILDRKRVAEIKEYYTKLKTCTNNTLRVGYVNVILGLVAESVSFETTNETIEAELSSRILFYLNENFRENISLKRLSTELGYTESYISRYFRRCFNIGFNRYLTLIRLKNSAVLLRENKYSITECAMDSGFNSMRTFYRAFAYEFNCTPKEYIQKIANS